VISFQDLTRIEHYLLRKIKLECLKCFNVQLHITKLINDFVSKLGSSCTRLRHLYTHVHVGIFGISQNEHYCSCIYVEYIV